MAAKRAKRAKEKPISGQKRILKILLIALIVLLLLAGGLFLFIQIKLGQIGRIGSTTYTEEDFDADTSAEDTIDSVDWGDAGVVTSVDGVVNILLVGQDTRVEGERARSDSMIILSINENTEQITMVSLMRDIYVQIPGYSNNKLNAAYQFGGFDLLDETIETNFGISIDYNVEVDFSGFQDIIDALDGVDITLYQAECDYLNEKYDWDLEAGVCHLDGAKALAYARLRYVGNSDFERTERQRTIIQAIYAKLKDESWTTLLDIYDICAENITTDMTNTQIISIALAAYSMDLDAINSYRIPANNAYTNEVVNGMQILVPTDWNETRQTLWSYLYADPEENEEDNQATSELENIATD